MRKKVEIIPQPGNKGPVSSNFLHGKYMLFIRLHALQVGFMTICTWITEPLNQLFSWSEWQKYMAALFFYFWFKCIL